MQTPPCKNGADVGVYKFVLLSERFDTVFLHVYNYVSSTSRGQWRKMYVRFRRLVDPYVQPQIRTPVAVTTESVCAFAVNAHLLVKALCNTVLRTADSDK